MPVTTTHVYVVPVGFVTDVRDIVLYNYGYFGYQPIDGVTIAATLDGAVIYTLRPPDARGFRLYHWTGRQILNYGDGITVTGLASSWTCRISGYELTSP